MLTNKYAEGYPGKRYYGGCEVVDRAETLAIERAKAALRRRARQRAAALAARQRQHGGLLRAPQAGRHAARAWTSPAAAISPTATGSPTPDATSRSSPTASTARASASTTTRCERLALAEQAEADHRGASAYSRMIDFARFRAIADEAGALLMADIAHIAGLVAAGLHPSPVPHCHFVTTTTHKTLRGPRGGLVLCKAEFAKEIDRAVFPGIQGGPLMHVIAAKAVALGEAATRGVPRLPAADRRQHRRASPRRSRRAASASSRAAPTTTSSSSTWRRAGLTGKVAEKALDARRHHGQQEHHPVRRRTRRSSPRASASAPPAVTTRGMGERGDGRDRRRSSPRCCAAPDGRSGRRRGARARARALRPLPALRFHEPSSRASARGAMSWTARLLAAPFPPSSSRPTPTRPRSRRPSRELARAAAARHLVGDRVAQAPARRGGGAGDAFLLQGGDCAESFDDCTSPVDRRKLKILLQMSLVLVHGLAAPGDPGRPLRRPVRQAALADREERRRLVAPGLPRRPDQPSPVRARPSARPTRSSCCAATSARADAQLHPRPGRRRLRRPAPPGVLGPRLRRAFAARRRVPARVSRRSASSLRFMETLAGQPVAEMNRVDFFTSHEGLHLLYEQAQTRRVPHREGWYDLTDPLALDRPAHRGARTARTSSSSAASPIRSA